MIECDPQFTSLITFILYGHENDRSVKLGKVVIEAWYIVTRLRILQMFEYKH